MCCNHEGTIIWNPWHRAVECTACGEQFFYADPVNHGQKLIKVWPDNEEEVLSELLFKSVRKQGEMSEIERPLFNKMARVALDWFHGSVEKSPENLLEDT